jgi:hypothetical protein
MYRQLRKQYGLSSQNSKHVNLIEVPHLLRSLPTTTTINIGKHNDNNGNRMNALAAST